MARKPTLTQVARTAGVSIATVDRVVNNRGGVDAGKEQAVLRAARDLGLDRRLDFSHRQIKRIILMVQPPHNPFHAELQNGAHAVRKIMSALNVHVSVVHITVQRPDETVRKIMAMPGKADGLIISSQQTPDIAAALHAIRPHVPVITLATDIEGSGRLAFVGPNDERSGRIAADLMGRFMGADGGDILLIAGRLDNAGHLHRVWGFESLLASRHPHCRVSSIIQTQERLDATLDYVFTSLSNNTAIRGIYHLSVGTVGIIDAIDRLGRHDVSVISHEMTPNRRRLLRQRRLQAVLDQDPHLEVRLAIENLARQFGRLDGLVTSVETSVQIYMPESI